MLQSAEPIAGRRRGASMLYSSGTTGRPKGARAYLQDVPPETPPPRQAGLAAAYSLTQETVFGTAAPFYHAAPLRIAMAVQRSGGTVIGFRKFDPEAMIDAIERHKATHGFFVPTMFRRMLDLPEAARDISDFHLASCFRTMSNARRVDSGSKLPTTFARRWHASSKLTEMKSPVWKLARSGFC